MRYELRSTEQYNKWFARLKILARLARAENGNFGDFRQLNENLFELRFFFGGGLRVYYTIRECAVTLLLAGGDKTTQTRDIDKAARLLHELEE